MVARMKKLQRRLYLTRKAYSRFVHRCVATLRVLSSFLNVLSTIAAAVCITAIVIYGGFEDRALSPDMVWPILRCVQAVFTVNVLFNLLFLFKQTANQSRAIKWILDTGIIISLLVWLSPRPSSPLIPVLGTVLYSPWFLITVLTAYSAELLSVSLIRIMGHRINPALILSSSFFILILIGSALLMMPQCTFSGISFTDSLFISTSAVCVTGLSTVDIPSTFTTLGLFIIAVMMQIGAIGVMTFTSFFALFFSGNISLYSQFMVTDMIYSKTINSLLPTLLYILLLTLVMEALGAFGIFLSIHGDIPDMTTRDEIIFAAFHSLSAFCNAGFSNLPEGLSNPALLHGNQVIYLIMSVLIVTGGIGYPILVNARDALFTSVSRLWKFLRHRPVPPRITHLMDLNTRVVLVTTTILLVAGTVSFLLLENHHSLSGMSPWEKLVQSIFNSVTPRTAGFASVNPGGFLNVTLILVMFLMWVGGGSQSTAGGIKVNTLAAVILHLRTTVTGRDKVVYHNRMLSTASVSRAQAVVFLSIASYIFYSVTMLIIEPDIPAKMLLFEVGSALGTVGLSIGATPLIGTGAKLLLCSAMFIGRVGLLSIIAGIAGSKNEPPVRYPSDNIIIN